MARFERGEYFWEIERDDTTVTRRHGAIGTPGEEHSRQTFANPLLARVAYHQAIGELRHIEYQPVGDPPPPLLDSLPSADDARLVYADVLQQRGDPLGELIVMQHAGVDTSALLERHAHAWFGDLADARDQYRFTWRLGRVSKVEVRPVAERMRVLVPGIHEEWYLPTLIEALLELPIARAVEAITVEQLATSPHRTLDVLSTHAPATLRRLHFLAGGTPRIFLGPRLGRFRFASLEELQCDVELDASALFVLASGKMPKLTTLSIRLADYKPAMEVQLRRLFEPRDMPALHELALSTPTPAILARIVIAAAPTRFSELVIRSERIDHDIVLPPYVRLEQVPIG